MQLRNLRTFVAVARTLNITRAAEEVHLAQSSVTEQVQTLEAELGAALLDRSRRGLKLTPAGERLLPYARELLELAGEAQAAVSDAAGVLKGRLVIGGLETLCVTKLPEVLTEFRERNPAVELVLKSADSGGLRRGIDSGDLDVGFLFGRPAAARNIGAEEVSEEELVVIAPPNHRLAGCSSISRDDLREDSFLVTQTGCVYRRMFEEAFAETLPDRPKIAGEFASIGAVRNLVASGLGCALVPRLAVPEAGGNVVALPWVGQSSAVPITMIWRRRRAQAPALRLFLSVAREVLGASRPVAVRHPRVAAFP